MRKVVVHYHLFKNAGSSVDALLEKSFGESWHAFDPEEKSAVIPSKSLAEIIEQNEDKVAFSSHCIVPPLPQGDFQVFPIVVLRDPIARVMSAYLFEWKKQIQAEKPKGTLTEYIQEKLSKPRANAIEDFQTIRLAVDNVDRPTPILKRDDELILEDARKFVESLPVISLVEEFSTSLLLLEDYLKPHFPEMQFDVQAKNTTQDTAVPMHERHNKIKEMIGTDTYNELVLRNQLDIKLYAYAKGRFDVLKKQYTKGQDSSEKISTLSPQGDTEKIVNEGQIDKQNTLPSFEQNDLATTSLKIVNS